MPEQEHATLGKLLDPRSQDLLDARSIILRKGDDLDYDYLLNRVRELGVEENW